MKVNTDGVLLGAWADVSNISRALDVGTGSGLIALMIAQRSDAVIDAVEIDRQAYEQACANASRSPWKNRIFCYHDSFQHFASGLQTRYDLIVSNPPFFSNALKPADKRKSKARHDTGMTYEELLKGTSALLTTSGRFCAILPFSEKDNFSDLAHIYGLYNCRNTCVKTTPETSFSRVLMAFGKIPVTKTDRTEITIHQANGRYSSDYIKITKDYYLTCPIHKNTDYSVLKQVSPI
ncbi:MAG: methyltransferase [Bacteroidales bacterium]|nr:methyltransferase [Bacteroidales bacterium]